ncbi:hypothetical protein AX15_007131 [Amanita polypyramis BW_CC]|nr:hypothetical protein AX15_007131 [Amanita polypyramis BW_CC]
MATGPKSKAVHSPVDEDVDDLDDVLSEFNDQSTAPQDQKQPGSSGRPRHNTRVDTRPTSVSSLGKISSTLGTTGEANEDALTTAFAQELAKEMEGLMREISGIDPSTLTGDTKDGGEEIDPEKVKEAEQALKVAWEAMLVEGMNGMGGADEDGLANLGEILGDQGLGPKKDDAKKGAPDNRKAGGAGATEKKNDFQEALKQAMNRMKETESNLQAGSLPKGAGETPEDLNELLASLKDMGLEDGSEEELAGFLQNMMGQLVSKDVLYEPLKELSDKFPGYLASPPSPLTPEDKQRYEKQHAVVKKVLAIFDAPDYSDENSESHKVIVELLSEIQLYGSPPSELMGPLPPGLGLGSDGLPQLGEGCVIV